jgi:hypothetical protein
MDSGDRLELHVQAVASVRNYPPDMLYPVDVRGADTRAGCQPGSTVRPLGGGARDGNPRSHGGQHKDRKASSHQG